MFRPRSSPWGCVQHIDRDGLPPGILRVSTASHGGYHLDGDRQRRLREMFPGFEPFAGPGPWYEEDCDWALVVLAFAPEFGSGKVRAAVRTAEFTRRISQQTTDRPSRWGSVIRWMQGTEEGREACRRASDWERRHAEEWEVSGISSAPPGWPVCCKRVHLRRIRDGAARTAILPSWPEQSLYTAEEVLRLIEDAGTLKGQADAKRAKAVMQ